MPNLSLAAEHGHKFRLAKNSGGSGEWQSLVQNVNDEWRSVAASVMQLYSMRTHGAFVQSKGSSIVWHFNESDLEFGQPQSKELQLALQQILADFLVVVRTARATSRPATATSSARWRTA